MWRDNGLWVIRVGTKCLYVMASLMYCVVGLCGVIVVRYLMATWASVPHMRLMYAVRVLDIAKTFLTQVAKHHIGRTYHRLVI